jgi:hypothetical protein
MNIIYKSKDDINLDKMSEESERVGFELRLGWLPDYPDFRDFDIEKDVVEEKQAKRGVNESVNTMLLRMDYREPLGARAYFCFQSLLPIKNLFMCVCTRWRGKSYRKLFLYLSIFNIEGR